ncbi:FAD-dependent monooxygenase [Nonomuraea salmonea]|uniref:FAD-dependent monooxygenase n=1 Tax=Nonomuraea salmonea TaxID=46181 RepID=UPI002FEC213A
MAPIVRGREALARDDDHQRLPHRQGLRRAATGRGGVERFRKRVARSRPDYADRVSRLESMDEVHLLHVRFDRLKRWHLDGLLLIGDAAHAITPR